jgi:hypothetical protein
MNVTVGKLEHIYKPSVDGVTYGVRIGGLGTIVNDAVRSEQSNFIEYYTERLVYIYDLLDIPHLGMKSRVVTIHNHETGLQQIREVEKDHVLGQRVLLNLGLYK